MSGNQAQTAAYRLSSSLPLTKNATAEGNTETIFEKIFYGAVYQKKKKIQPGYFCWTLFLQRTKFKHKPSQTEGFNEGGSRSEQNSEAIQVP